MWARVAEFMVAWWLAMSPFIFRHSADEPMLWVIDFAAAFLVATFALISYVPSLWFGHLLTIAVGLLLCGQAYFQVGEHPVDPALQNQFVVGLILLMLSIIPNHVAKPPQSWLDYAQHTKSADFRRFKEG